MPDYYIYSPFQGTSKGQLCYCTNCANGNPCNNGAGGCTTCGSTDGSCIHLAAIDNLNYPVDIFAAANTQVKLYTSGNIRSVRITHTGRPRAGQNNNGDGLCAAAPPAGFEWVDEGVRVELFCNLNATGTLIGTVFYGHLRNRKPAGTYNYPQSPLLIMGLLGDQNCPNNCGCCYHGIHVHMACSASNNGYFYPRACGTVVYPGISPVYRWTISNPTGCL